MKVNNYIYENDIKEKYYSMTNYKENMEIKHNTSTLLESSWVGPPNGIQRT